MDYRQEVLQRVTSRGYGLKFATKNLRNDREIVHAAVKSDGSMLKYASESLQNNKEIVEAAVLSEGLAILYASHSLQNCEEMALKAVNQNPDIFYFLQWDLRTNYSFRSRVVQANMNNAALIKDVVQFHGNLLKYASDKVKDDIEVVREAVKSNCCALRFASERVKNDILLLPRALKFCAMKGCGCIVKHVIITRS